MFKKLFALLCLVGMVSTAQAETFRLIVPQNPGGGTDVWARIVAGELEKKLPGDTIIVENIPGARDIPGFNKFHNELRYDPNVIMVSNGGNAEDFLLSKVNYNYNDYALLGLQNLTIVVGKRNDSNPEKRVRFAAGSGQNPDTMAITMLVCGPQKSFDAYLKCFNDKITYVPGMKGGERRLSYMRGELNVTRESPAAYKKHPSKVPENVTWFTHGILDLKTGAIVDDRNFKGLSFAEVYKKRWGVAPSGDFYDAYVVLKNYRDVLQKALWVDKKNPNRAKLENAIRAMVNDPVSRKALIADSGDYDWIIGERDGARVLDILGKQTSAKNLKNLVWWNSQAYGQKPVYKPELAKQ
jgi:hypothetical protein